MIIRRRHTKNFTTISNVLFDDERLAADEVGILAYLLSRPDNWEIRRPALARRWGVGPVTIKRVVRSWMKAGWCQATKVRLPNGTFCILYDISDVPGEEMTEDQVREALSLVSSEASSDDSDGISEAENHPYVSDGPPLRQPLVADHPVVTGGVAYIEDITNTDLSKTDQSNSERELARAREKHALGLAEFKRRYPTAASDDQGKIDDEWFKLELDEGEPAITGIPAFLEKLKRDRRTTVPAAWKYLKEKRWTLLEEAQTATSNAQTYARDSIEGKALVTLHDIGGVGEFFRHVNRRSEAGYFYRGAVTDRIRALAQAPKPDAWVEVNRQQAAAWEGFLREHITANRQRKMTEHSRAPWPWPPSVDGKLYTSATGPPETYMSEEDFEHFDR